MSHRQTWVPGKTKMKTKGLRVSLDKMENFSSSIEKKVIETAGLLEIVMQSEEFFEAVLNHQFKGKRAYNQPNGMSNAEIYDYMMSGREPLSRTSKVDKIMNLHLIGYYEEPKKNSKGKLIGTVGYGLTNSDKIYCNEWYYNTYSRAEIAGNLTHEWLHNMGFKHPVNWTPTRDFTVPYAVGYQVRGLAAILEGRMF